MNEQPCDVISFIPCDGSCGEWVEARTCSRAWLGREQLGHFCPRCDGREPPRASWEARQVTPAEMMPSS